jgi:parallel beta-helix repeat protein
MPASADKHGPGILRVVGGATLDLKWPHGDVQQSGLGNPGGCRDLTNGTVRGCSAGVVAGNAIVRNMTLIDNYSGVEMTGEQSSGANLIVGNIATGGNFGFFVEEAHDNTFLDNQAIGNASAGFYLGDSHGNALSGNVTTGSGAGFKIYAEANLFGNRALKNVGAGFVAQGRGIQRVGNIAKKNGGPGFNLDTWRTRASISTRPRPTVATVSRSSSMNAVLSAGSKC